MTLRARFALTATDGGNADFAGAKIGPNASRILSNPEGLMRMDARMPRRQDAESGLIPAVCRLKTKRRDWREYHAVVSTTRAWLVHREGLTDKSLGAFIAPSGLALLGPKRWSRLVEPGGVLIPAVCRLKNKKAPRCRVGPFCF